MALARARSRRQPGHAANPGAFRLPEHPPGVGGDMPAMAQDEAITSSLAWAAQAQYSSAFAEGATFLGYAYLAALAQRPEYRVVSEEIASEMTREWIEFDSADDEDKSAKVQQLEKALTRLNVRDAFRRAAEGDGFFGRGHLYLDTGEGDDAEELASDLGDGASETSRFKINQNTKRRLIGVKPVEAVWCYPTNYNSNNPLADDWYHPTGWMVMAKRLHSSRLLTLIGRPVPDLLKPAYSFGGLSMSQMIKPYVDNWLRTRQSIADLIHNFSVMVLATNMGADMQADATEFFKRLEMFTLCRDNQGVMAIDKETEDFKNISAPVSGLSELQAQTQEHMAAVARIPIVKLLGIQPAGLNASSEGEIRSFYDWIKAFQEALFRPPLQTVIWLVMLGLWGEVDHSITFHFKDLWQLDEAGKVAIEKTKTDIDTANVALGALDSESVRLRLASDKDSIYHGLDLSGPAPGVPGEGEFGDPDLSDPSDSVASRIIDRSAAFGNPASGGFPNS